MLPPKPLLDPALAHAPAAASSSRLLPRPPKRPSRLATKQSSPDPSSGILALLVTVAGSSSADGRPLDSSDVPPDFLCPRLHAWSLPQSASSPPSSSSAAQQQPSWYWEPCDAAEAAAYVDIAVRRRKRRPRKTSNNIADKYVQGSDGRWRKADSWELYGSSSCSPSGCMDTTKPTEFPVQDDQVSPSTGSVTATSSTAPSPSLPPGWDKGKVDDTMTGMILALSLSLAVALIVFMMGIVRWRQKRQARQDPDAEGTPSDPDRASVESEELKRARTQQRLWAKASARWVANVRQSARRRRKRMAATTAKDSDGRVLRDAQASTSAISLARTTTAHDFDRRPSSPSSVRSSRRTRTSSRSPSPASSDRHREASGAGPSPHHPPAYLQSPSSAFQHAYPRWHSHPLDTAPDSHHGPGITPTELPPPCSADRSPPPSLSPLPYEAPVHSAHVAVDDKAVLARLAEFASAPPLAADGPSSPEVRGGSSEMQPSVPVLDDDPYEGVPLDIEFDADGAPSGSRPDRRSGLASQAHDAPPAPPHGSPPLGLAPHARPSVSIDALDTIGPRDGDEEEGDDVPSYAEDVLRHRPVLLLPPPPAKVPLTGPMFYEYPDEFERDVETVEPVEEPSAPPFGEPSSPPLDFGFPEGDALDLAHAHMMAPSAPPLEYVVEEPPGSESLVPSAPPLALADDEDAPSTTSHSSHDGSATAASHAGGGRSAPLSHSPDDQGNARASAHATVDGGSGAHATPDSPAPPQYLP
ncbi:hypothetical protein C8Q77DRAFT_1152783 [Trametes polyzona]|nr:hypothetical protein C8Q77DRAFT_1152783 [Trametes polyzona]